MRKVSIVLDYSLSCDAFGMVTSAYAPTRRTFSERNVSIYARRRFGALR
jgi:hypothetical protein